MTGDMSKWWFDEFLDWGETLQGKCRFLLSHKLMRRYGKECIHDENPEGKCSLESCPVAKDMKQSDPSDLKLKSIW